MIKKIGEKEGSTYIHMKKKKTNKLANDKSINAEENKKFHLRAIRTNDLTKLNELHVGLWLKYVKAINIKVSE